MQHNMLQWLHLDNIIKIFKNKLLEGLEYIKRIYYLKLKFKLLFTIT